MAFINKCKRWLDFMQQFFKINQYRNSSRFVKIRIYSVRINHKWAVHFGWGNTSRLRRTLSVFIRVSQRSRQGKWNVLPAKIEHIIMNSSFFFIFFIKNQTIEEMTSFCTLITDSFALIWMIVLSSNIFVSSLNKNALAFLCYRWK